MTDASFRDCENSAFTAGYVIRLFGDVIAWKSRKINYASLSTCEAEYLAISDACKELISIDKSIRYVNGRTLFPVTIWCDNSSSRNCTEIDGSHKLKSFDLSIKEIKEELEEREKTGKRKTMDESHGDYVKQCVDEGRVKVRWISTNENIADIMTKPLPKEAHNYLRDKMTNIESEFIRN